MYFYLYDTFLKERKYAGSLTKIENRLIDLGINGKIEKMNILKSAKEVLENAIKDGAQTIVAVGNDKTFIDTLKIVSTHKNIALGFIPLVSGNIAKILGLPLKEAACDILSARIIAKIDLGKVNSHYFFGAVEIPAANSLTIECDHKYTVESTSPKVKISIRNLGPIFSQADLKNSDISNPSDGYLELVFESGKAGPIFKKRWSMPSVFPIKKATIKSPGEPVAVKIDNQTTLKTPLNVSVAAKTLKIIVGKERMF